MDYVVYEDTPRADIWIKLIIILPSALLLITSIILLPVDLSATLYFILMALLLGIIFLFVIPVKYSILNSSIRIQFRGPLAFAIPFETIVTVRQARWSTVGINLPANMSQSNAVEIVRHRRMSVTITPADKQAFIHSFEKAIKDWQQQQ